VTADTQPAPTANTPPTPVAPQPPDVQAGPVTVSRTSRARVRPRGSRKELAVWYLMRVTAVMLFVLALGHFSILHFIYDPATQNAQFIADERWNQVFWRGFDWLLLVTVIIHAFLGVRTVVIDYFRPAVLRNVTLWVLYIVGVVLFVLGTQVVWTLPTSALTTGM
jgi:succinate dehydrogenase / fumarate reductase membrane anchor subunit